MPTMKVATVPEAIGEYPVPAPLAKNNTKKR
jgi:hypothetical protein